MAERQQAMLGEHVDELTVYVAPVRDTGNREVFLSVQASRKRYQGRQQVADWVSTDAIVSVVAVLVRDIEAGSVRPWECVAALIEGLDQAEREPF